MNMIKRLLAVLATGFFLVGMVGLANATMYRFDANAGSLGGGGSPTQSGFTSVFYNTVYNSSIGYGWDHKVSDRSRVAIPGDPLSNLLRDFHFSHPDATFKVDVAVNGLYNITLYFRDNQYMHDTIQVFAEGGTNPSVNIASLPRNTTFISNFATEVSDGQLDLRFHNGIGGTDPNWIINGIQVDGPAVPEPGTIMLLGIGILGLAIYGKRRMNNKDA
jgi:hypothetical protein